MRPVNTENESCMSCRFWAGVQPTRVEENRVVFNGQCRKTAPIMKPDGTAGWPATVSTDWCAAYEQGQTPDEVRRFL